MPTFGFPNIVALAACVAFVAAGIVHVTGPAFVRRAYFRWGYSRLVYFGIGILEILIALLIFMPKARETGIWLGGIVNFVTVVSLLKHREYSWSLPGLALAFILPVTFVTNFHHG